MSRRRRSFPRRLRRALPKGRDWRSSRPRVRAARAYRRRRWRREYRDELP